MTSPSLVDAPTAVEEAKDELVKPAEVIESLYLVPKRGKSGKRSENAVLGTKALPHWRR